MTHLVIERILSQIRSDILAISANISHPQQEGQRRIRKNEVIPAKKIMTLMANKTTLLMSYQKMSGSMTKKNEN